MAASALETTDFLSHFGQLRLFCFGTRLQPCGRHICAHLFINTTKSSSSDRGCRLGQLISIVDHPLLLLLVACVSGCDTLT